MDDWVLTNREVATLVVLGLGLGWLLRRARGTDRSSSLRGLLSALLQWQVLVPLVLYLVWMGTVLIWAAEIGLWSSDLWKPTVLWLLLTGFGLLFKFPKAISEPGFFRQVLLRTVGIVAVVEYVANLASFPLWVEVPTQALAVLFALLAVSGDDPKHAPVRMVANGYLGILGLSTVAWTVWRLASERSNVDFEGLVWELLLPIWLTPPTIVYVYLVAVWAAYDSAFRQMGFTAEGESQFRQKLAVVLRTTGRRSMLRRLRSGSWHLGRTSGFREAWTAVGMMMLQERKRVAAESAFHRRLIDNAGRVGVDASGRQLDQREHRETKKVLRTLANWQFGHYRKSGGRYQTDLAVEHLAEREGLPVPSGIRIHVDRSGQRWYAERRTITGHWFAIGAAGPPTDQWMYDGPQPPLDYPNETEWDHWMGDDNAPNWD